MSTARTVMFSWLPVCLEHSAIPTFLSCCSCAHEPCSSGQGWCEEQLGEGAGSGHTRSRRSERQDQRQGSVTLEVQVAAQGCATSHCLETRHCAEPRRWTFAAQRRRSRARVSMRQRRRRIPQPRAGSVPPEQVQRVGGFQSVCGSASFWSTGCSQGCDYWSLTANGKAILARDVRRAFLKEVDKPNVHWARIPCKVLATGAAKTPTWCPFLLVHEMLASLVEKHAG